jgi:hypothetical protein
METNPMSNITGRLLNAERVTIGDGYIIVREVYEDIHGRFDNGSLIRTSLIVHEDGNVISTKNSIYEVESWRSTPDIETHGDKLKYDEVPDTYPRPAGAHH